MTPEQLRHTADVLARAQEAIASQQQTIKDLKERNLALEATNSLLSKYARATELHNADCARLCNGGANCGYAGYLKRTGRRCSSCPVEFQIDIMPAKGNA